MVYHRRGPTAYGLEDDFPYCLYLGGPPARLSAITRALKAGLGAPCLSVPGPGPVDRGGDGGAGPGGPAPTACFTGLKNWLGALPAGLECYNCDLDVATYYLYVRRLFPCAWYVWRPRDGRLLRLEPQEEPFALEFYRPPLTTLTLGLTRDPLIPLGAGNGLALGWEGETLELEAPDIPGLLRDLAHRLKRADPDLVLSAGGDAEIIPTLTRWSLATGVPLPLDRETGPVHRKFTGSRSYFSYGRIVYQGPAGPVLRPLAPGPAQLLLLPGGRPQGAPPDRRIGQMPLQRAARASPGTLITSMQLARAMADGILIPWRKGEPEHFKTAGELLTIDKGGLTFMPRRGLHFNVAEVDFASMYPTIMAIHNISPETVNCSCCAETAGTQKAVISEQWPVVRKALAHSPTPVPQSFQLGSGKARPDACTCRPSAWVLEAEVGGVALPALRLIIRCPRSRLSSLPPPGGSGAQNLKTHFDLREQLKARAKELPPERRRRTKSGRLP